VLVLPPADGLAESERARVRMLVDRALDAGGDATTGAVVLEPMTADALVDTVRLAVRRAGPGGMVCVLAADVGEQVAQVLALHPATRGCLLPVPATAEESLRQSGRGSLLVADVDLAALGRSLGAAARAAAGERTVVVLSSGDAMLDRRWSSGVEGGALGTSGTAGAVTTMGTAAEVLALLDDQEALLRDGTVPGSPAARGFAADEVASDLPEEDRPAALALPPVGVVVLDAGPEAALLLGPLVERGVLVVVPRSILIAEGAAEDTVVLRWRIRWDVPLGGLLRPGTNGGAGALDDAVVLEPGPAHVAP